MARYLAFAALALAGPGLAVQRALVARPDPALVLPLGTAMAALLYWLSLVAGQGWLFVVAVLLLDVVVVAALFKDRRSAGPASGPLSDLSWRVLAVPAVVLVALLALTQYRWNRPSASGEFLLDPLVLYDTAFHVGLARELTLGYPPQVPGVSGFPLGYHLGTDLVRAAALRWAAVDPFDSISRGDVTLGALALMVVLVAAARRLGATGLTLALVPWTLLATDLSFVFAANPQAHWWTDLLRGNILLSLFLANPVVPALSLVLGSLLAADRHLHGEGMGWAGLAALQAAAVPFFKVFLGAHLVLGLTVAWLLRPAARRTTSAVLVPAALATAALALGQGGQTVDLTWAPLDLVRVTRESLGLVPLSGLWLVTWSAGWLLASLGLRLVGLPTAWHALRSGSVLSGVLAAMALVAWPLGLLFRVSAPEVLPGQKIVNDAAYWIEQGGPLLWLFTVLALGAFVAGGRTRRWVVLAAAAVLALPSTVQFVVKKARTAPDPLPAAMVRAMRDVAESSRPGDVVLQRPGGRYPPAPVILIGRRVAYERFTPWLTQFAPAAALEARHQTVFRFFRTTDRDEALAIAAALGARCLCLYGPDRVRFAGLEAFPVLHLEDGARCYALPPAAGSVEQHDVGVELGLHGRPARGQGEAP